MEFITNTDNAIPKDRIAEIRSTLKALRGVTKVKIYEHSIHVNMPITTSNEDYVELSHTLAAIEYFLRSTK